MLPRISIVTPSFNQARFLRQCIESVVSQDYPNLEYIIIDGGSTDGSVEIIRDYSNRLAYWVSEPDRGQSNAINKGLNKCSGEIEGWLNSDDFLLPGALKSVASMFDLDPAVGVVIGQRICVDEMGSPLESQSYFVRNLFMEMIAYTTYPPQECCFWRRRVRDLIGTLREDLHYSMDFDWFLRLACVARAKAIRQQVGVFRCYPAQKSNSRIVAGEGILALRDAFLARSRIPMPAWRAIIHAYRLWRRITGEPVTIRKAVPHDWCYERKRNPPRDFSGKGIGRVISEAE